MILTGLMWTRIALWTSESRIGLRKWWQLKRSLPLIVNYPVCFPKYFGLWKYHAIHIIRYYGPVHGPNYLLNVLESWGIKLSRWTKNSVFWPILTMVNLDAINNFIITERKIWPLYFHMEPIWLIDNIFIFTRCCDGEMQQSWLPKQFQVFDFNCFERHIRIYRYWIERKV